jgi:hypothetical protein
MSNITSPSIENAKYRTPSDVTMQHAVKIAILEDRPIMMDYWTLSLDKSIVIGVNTETNENLLVKNGEEYTSPISKFLKSGEDLIVKTENSIYIVSADIPQKRVH